MNTHGGELCLSKNIPKWRTKSRNSSEKASCEAPWGEASPEGESERESGIQRERAAKIEGKGEDASEREGRCKLRAVKELPRGNTQEDHLRSGNPLLCAKK